MLVLVPPSESKRNPAGRGRPVDLAALSFPDLNPLRERVLDRLVELAGRPDAGRLLGVGATLSDEVARNAAVRTLPARPAHDVYCGVLHEALGWDTLSSAARRRAGTRLVVVSALWGALRPRDRVPPYRLSMGVDLPGLGPLAPAWRGVLGPGLTAAAGVRGLVVDCRSSSYAAAWAPGPQLARRTVAVRVVRQAPDGGRSVVSHMAKHTRGEVARHLLETGADPRTPQGLADVLADRWDVELSPPPATGRSWAVDVVLPG